MIGQAQINSLLETIFHKDQEILSLKSKVSQYMLTKKSTYILLIRNSWLKEEKIWNRNEVLKHWGKVSGI